MAWTGKGSPSTGRPGAARPSANRSREWPLSTYASSPECSTTPRSGVSSRGSPIVEVEGKGDKDFAQFCWVIVDEIDSGMLGVAGQGQTTEDVKQARGG